MNGNVAVHDQPPNQLGSGKLRLTASCSQQQRGYSQVGTRYNIQLEMRIWGYSISQGAFRSWLTGRGGS